MSHQKCVRRECVRRKNVRRKNFDQTCKLYTIGPRRGDQIEWMGRKRCPRGAPRRGEQKIIKSFFYFISPSHIPLLLCNSPTPLIELWLSPQQWRCVLIHCWDFLLYCFCLPGRFKQSFNWHPPPHPTNRAWGYHTFCYVNQWTVALSKDHCKYKVCKTKVSSDRAFKGNSSGIVNWL